MKMLKKTVVALAFAAGLFIGTASAAETHTAVTLDTRAMILAEILPESCTYATTPGDYVTLTVTFTANLSGVGPYELPDDMGPLAFNVNGKTITGKAGTNGSSSTNGGAGSPVFKVGSGTTISISGSSGSIVGGKGGDGNPAGKGAFAFVDAKGVEFAVSAPEGLVKKGDDGAFLPPSDWKLVGTNAWLYTEDGIGHIVGEGVATNLPSGFVLNSITNAVVDEGITEIGARFFKKCSKLNMVTLGKDVTSVGTNSFYLCVALERIKVENAAAVESLNGAIVYRTAIDPDNKPYVIPYIDAPNYENVLYATDDLVNPVWQPIDPKEAFADGAPARFFKFVLEPITIK